MLETNGEIHIAYFFLIAVLSLFKMTYTFLLVTGLNDSAPTSSRSRRDLAPLNLLYQSVALSKTSYKAAHLRNSLHPVFFTNQFAESISYPQYQRCQMET